MLLDRLYRFLDYFLPAGEDVDDEDRVNRIRLSVGLAWFIGLVALVFAVAYPYIAPVVIPITRALAYGLAVGFLLAPWVLRATGAVRPLGIFLTNVPLVVLVLVAWNSHGIRTPGLYFLPVPVLIGLGLGGRRIGALTTLVAVAAVAVLAGVEISGARSFPPIESGETLMVVVITLGLTMVIGIGWFYETTRVGTLARLREALAAAEAANKAKRDFLASMSHELRTPLNSVIGFSQVVRSKEELSSSGDDMLERVHASGLHLLGLVDQILDVTKVEAGEIELDLEAVDLIDLIRLTLRDLDTQKPREQVELLSELPPECAPLATDREKLRQIVVNLVVNAFKFTRNGSVTVRLITADAATPGSAGSPGAAALEVEDTGIGIPPEKLEAIFERFVQVDTGTSRKFEGTGLGLSICKDLCDLLGYKLGVESEVDRGTKFTVSF